MGTTERQPGGDAPPSPFALLFAPDRAMDRQAKVGRVRGYLLFAWASSLLLGAALALRVDAHASTLRKLEQSGRLAELSDRQIAEETLNAERVSMVGSLAKGLFGPPVSLGLACLAVVLLVWFFRGRLKGAAVANVAAATMLPGSIATLLDAASAFMHAAIPPDGAPLAPRSVSALLAIAGRAPPDPWVKLGDAADFFSLWGAVMMGYAVVAAGQVPKRTAIVGTLVAWVCLRLLTHVAAGG